MPFALFFFRYGHLRYAFLRYAFLRYTSLRYSSLRYGYLRYSCLRYGYLRYAIQLWIDAFMIWTILVKYWSLNFVHTTVKGWSNECWFEKRESRLNKRSIKVEKRRSFVKASDKLNFEKKNAPYMTDRSSGLCVNYVKLSRDKKIQTNIGMKYCLEISDHL